VDMVQFRGDAHFDETRRVAHHGTFNANPVAAAAGVKATELVATTTVNVAADHNAERLKQGLNDVFRAMKVPGCAHGVASIVNFEIGAECECGGAISRLRMDALKTKTQVLQWLYRASLNAGLDWMGGTFFVSAVHTNSDIDDSVAAFEEALAACRAEQVL